MRWSIWLTLAVLALAAMIRFSGLGERGIYYHDEAAFVANARFYGGLARFTLDAVCHGIFSVKRLGEEAQHLYLEGGSPAQSAKPFYSLVQAAAVVVAGSHDWVALAVSALAGCLSVWVLTRVRTSAGSRVPGLVAAFLLAISVWHAHYSRSGLSQAVSVLMVTLLLVLLVNQTDRPAPLSRRRMWLIGTLTACAFLSHYNLFWLPLVVGAWLGWQQWSQAACRREWLLRMLDLAAAMLLPLLLCEAGYQLLMPLAKARISGTAFADKAIIFATYVQQVHYQVFWFDRLAPVRTSALRVWREIAQLESVPYMLVGLSGALYLLVAAVRRNAVALLLAAAVFTPALVWSWFGYPAIRAFVPALPPLLLGVGFLVESIHRRYCERSPARLASRIVLLAIAAVLLAAQLPALARLATAQSPWRIACRQLVAYLGQHPGHVVADAELAYHPYPIYRYYLGTALDRSRQQGDIFIADVESGRRPTKESIVARAQELAAHASPIISVPTRLTSAMILMDNYDFGLVSWYRANADTISLRVYDTSVPQPVRAASGAEPRP